MSRQRCDNGFVFTFPFTKYKSHPIPTHHIAAKCMCNCKVEENVGTCRQSREQYKVYV